MICFKFNTMFNYCSRAIYRTSRNINSKSFSLSVIPLQNQGNDLDKDVKAAEEYLMIERKPKAKMPQLVPFAKGLFLGKFDKVIHFISLFHKKRRIYNLLLYYNRIYSNIQNLKQQKSCRNWRHSVSPFLNYLKKVLLRHNLTFRALF